MAKETVDKILEAERAAENAEAEARDRASEMIETAKADAALFVEQKIREAEEEADRLAEKAGSDAEKIMSNASSGEELQVPARKKEAAIDECIKMLIQTGGR